MIADRLRMTKSGESPYLFKEGSVVDWVQGYTYAPSGTGSQSINGYIYIHAADVRQSVRTYVTDSPVDLTGKNTIYITWANLGYDLYNTAYLIVSTSKMDSYTVYDAIIDKDGKFSWTTESLDISSLSGDYYVRVHGRDKVYGSERIAKVYVSHIWLE